MTLPRWAGEAAADGEGRGEARDVRSELSAVSGSVPRLSSSGDPYLDFLGLVYEKIPNAAHLIPLEDLIDMAKAALAESEAG